MVTIKKYTYVLTSKEHTTCARFDRPMYHTPIGPDGMKCGFYFDLYDSKDDAETALIESGYIAKDHDDLVLITMHIREPK